MINFIPDEIDNFLATVRKYMQLRGGLSQKELAQKAGVGISTMSRFLNQKTKELDPQMIAKIVATLDIPLHEVIDFVAEESTSEFKRLISFLKGGEPAPRGGGDTEMEAIESGLDSTSTRQKTSAHIRGVKMNFGQREGDHDLSIKEKLNRLSPRQKGFLTDFLDLDVEGRDLIVDVSNALFRYFKQGDADF